MKNLTINVSVLLVLLALNYFILYNIIKFMCVLECGLTDLVLTPTALFTASMLVIGKSIWKRYRQ